jgi:translation initiation factor 3 subunit L
MASSRRESTMEQFAYFAAIEKIRLECLLGDYGSALDACGLVKLGDRTEPYYGLPSCHVNLYYHVGVCQMMLRKYSAAIDTFVDISLHTSRAIKLSANSSTKKDAVEQLMKKMLDKILALTAVCVALSPGVRLDDQVREMMESKYPEKIRRMQIGNITAFSDLFESACPRFISPAIPDYTVQSNLCAEMGQNQVSNFVREVQQHVGALKLRSYLRLYASIEVEKLARFSDSSVEDLVSQALSYKLKMFQEQSLDGAERFSDVDYSVKDGSMVIDSVPVQVDKSNAAESFFFAGMRKNADILKDLEKSYQSILK